MSNLSIYYLKNRIDAMRKRKQWSLMALADQADLHYQTVWNAVNGPDLPTIKTIRALSVALECDLIHLQTDAMNAEENYALYLSDIADQYYREQDLEGLEDHLEKLEQLSLQAGSLSESELLMKVADLHQGLLLQKRGYKQRAKDLWKNSLGLDSNALLTYHPDGVMNGRIYMNLGIILAREGEYDEAIRILCRCLQPVFPNRYVYTVLLFNLCRLFYQTDQFNTSLAIAKKGARLAFENSFRALMDRFVYRIGIAEKKLGMDYEKNWHTIQFLHSIGMNSNHSDHILQVIQKP